MNLIEKLSFFLRRYLKVKIWTIIAVCLIVVGISGTVIVGLSVPYSPFFWVSAVFAAFFLIVFHFNSIVDFFSSNILKDIGSTTTFILFILILIFLNILASRRPIKIDLTSNRLYTISPVTKRILKEVKSPIRIIFFRTPSQINKNISDILRLYAKACRFIKIEEVDPEANPLLAKKYDLQSLPFNNEPVFSTIFIEQDGKTEKVDGLKVDFVPNYYGNFQPVVDIDRDLEKKITSAIDRLKKPVMKIYFTAGHGEGDLLSSEKNGYSRLKNYLSQENYDTDFFYPAMSHSVPSDASLIVILDPRKNFEEKELNLLEAYLETGGRILILVNPLRKTGLDLLTKKWGFYFSSGVVYDPGSCYWFQPAILYITRYGLHKVVENLNTASVLPEACDIVRLKDSDPDIRIRELVRTSDRSWLELDLNEKPSYDEKVDKKGPLVVALSAEKSVEGENGPEIMAFGDADFVANTFIDLGANLDLFLNCVNYLAGKKELADIKSREPLKRIMILSPASLRFVFLISVILIPLFFLVSGIFLFWKRRRL